MTTSVAPLHEHRRITIFMALAAPFDAARRRRNSCALPVASATNGAASAPSPVHLRSSPTSTAFDRRSGDQPADEGAEVMILNKRSASKRRNGLYDKENNDKRGLAGPPQMADALGSALTCKQTHGVWLV